MAETEDAELQEIYRRVDKHPQEADYPPPRGWASYAVIAFVRVYQRLARPILPPSCRFHPSCSDYMILAVRKHGACVGMVRGVGRICRCHPYCAGGVDYP